MTTPHINAKKKDFSDFVLMPGDPIRSKYIAKNYLDNVIEVTNVRSMLGFTGYYKGRRISIMSHGIGIPSCLIYVQELITEYNVSKIVRIGTCGTVCNNIDLYDLIICLGASTDSNINKSQFQHNNFSAVANFDLVCNLVSSSKNLGIPVHIGNFFSTDLFYNNNYDIVQIMKRYNIIGLEMETAGLYSISAEFGIKSASICTVSDHIIKKSRITFQDRESSLDKMIKVALDSTLLDLN
ncbi:purine-nucleoside phosphorylase [Buchnera aphidicola]|uniref:Purine nucleoside phosphorylase DeoD-type n=1 Tax=Buchnera aphidicola subsp. Melaphis rhois TaxID=118103 RepID=A0A4D6Y4I2_BUCMH|nr:purine-nucleoside phosphorylase [Buchnera aphidicola]QCI23493.1 purine-nucleoside phosphorylase [Buchnera aphidicola (Melaphis rhois)]